MIPILTLVFGYPIKIAIGCVIISLLPASIISSIFNANNKNIDYKTAFILEIPTIFGTVLGAYLTNITEKTLKIMIGIALVLAASSIAFKAVSF